MESVERETGLNKSIITFGVSGSVRVLTEAVVELHKSAMDSLRKAEDVVLSLNALSALVTPLNNEKFASFIEEQSLECTSIELKNAIVAISSLVGDNNIQLELNIFNNETEFNTDGEDNKRQCEQVQRVASLVRGRTFRVSGISFKGDLLNVSICSAEPDDWLISVDFTELETRLMPLFFALGLRDDLQNRMSDLEIDIETAGSVVKRGKMMVGGYGLLTDEERSRSLADLIYNPSIECKQSMEKPQYHGHTSGRLRGGQYIPTRRKKSRVK